MKKKGMSAAVTLCALLTLCACGGRHNAWREPVSMATEEEEQKETKAESDLPQEETDTADDAAQAALEVTPLTGTAYVRVDGCKIKNGPGKEYETAGTLGLLEELRVTGETRDKSGEEWYRIAAPKTLENGSLPEGDYYIEKSQVRQ